MGKPRKFNRVIRVAAALIAIGCTTEGIANELYFQMNPNFTAQGQREVFIFGPDNATGTVTSPNGFSSTFDLGTDGFSTVTLSIADSLTANTVENNGFVVSSSEAVSGYFLNRLDFTTDMTYLIDGDRLGTSYVVAGYRSSSINTPDQISVQATQDNTTVTFSLKDGTTTTQTLNKGQTFLTEGNSELTGSTVVADKPIAVFSGNRCANVPNGVFACDHIVEQLPSVDQLSTEYYLARTQRSGPNGNVARVVATADGTVVSIDGTQVATLNKGDFYEFRVGVDGSKVNATEAVLVTEYLIGQTEANANTDPAMTIVPGADQWLDAYVFATPSGVSDFPVDFVSIIMQTADISTLLIDGIAATTIAGWTMIDGIYSFGDVDVSNSSGPLTFEAASPFQLLLSGHDNFDSYLTYGGAAFSPGASPPPPPVDPPPPSSDVPIVGTLPLLVPLAGMLIWRRRKQ